MIKHETVLRKRAEYETKRTSAKLSIEGLEDTMSSLAQNLREQKRIMAMADGAMEALDGLLEGSDVEAARVAGILRGLRRGVLTYDDVELVNEDLVIDIKETAEVVG